MMTIKTENAQIMELLDRPIAFHRPLVDVAGGVLGALMLSQALYWSKRTEGPLGWFWKTQAEWEEETGMGRREQETARARLRQTRFWQEDLRGIPAKVHFRVDLDLLAADLLGRTCQTSMAESAKLVCRKATNKKGGKRHTGMAESAIHITETTPETTAETTAKSTHTEQQAQIKSVCVSHASEVESVFKDAIASGKVRNPGAYRVALEKAALAGRLVQIPKNGGPSRRIPETPDQAREMARAFIERRRQAQERQQQQERKAGS